ncbi:small membrane protein [Klebsiella pneumoniae]|nr:small membrane protein [Klebsiella pneumoniae]QRR78382.1 small membrane protein [Klebsiella pneumoniae]
MAMQTWLVLLLCIYFFSISVYSFISYLKDRRRQKLTFNDKRSMRRK